MADEKTAIVTGVGGQDGFYLTEHLLSKGYRIIGTSHRDSFSSSLCATDLEIEVLRLDLCSAEKVKELVFKIRPKEIYNLAARSSSGQLFDDPVATAEINGLAAVRFLEAIREVSPCTRFCQAASSEIFAGCEQSPQDEATPYRPLNAYGAAKVYAANIVTAYRERYGLYATTAILFNHESPRRSLEYVTRKITHAVAMIARGLASELVLGNLDSFRDWGFAGDYARAMHLMLQQPSPEDYVIATGESHSVREFCEIAFSYVGLDYRQFVRIDPSWSRRAETIELRGNPAKARERLGWKSSICFPDLVRMMVDADLVGVDLKEYRT